MTTGIIVGIIAVILIASCVKVVPQANAYILERLGGYEATWDVGIHWKWPRLRVVFHVQIYRQILSGNII